MRRVICFSDCFEIFEKIPRFRVFCHKLKLNEGIEIASAFPIEFMAPFRRLRS